MLFCFTIIVLIRYLISNNSIRFWTMLRYCFVYKLLVNDECMQYYSVFSFCIWYYSSKNPLHSWIHQSNWKTHKSLQYAIIQLMWSACQGQHNKCLYYNHGVSCCTKMLWEKGAVFRRLIITSRFIESMPSLLGLS